MTTKKLQTILEMVDRGCLQKDIAKAVNVSVSTVSIWARKYGRVRIPRRYCLKMYTIYGKDGQYAFEGTARESAEYLGIQYQSFRRMASQYQRYGKGQYAVYPSEVEA